MKTAWPQNVVLGQLPPLIAARRTFCPALEVIYEMISNKNSAPPAGAEFAAQALEIIFYYQFYCESLAVFCKCPGLTPAACAGHGWWPRFVCGYRIPRKILFH